ncbi:MAG: hypothetical protein U0166_18920 [Acidobacteriota bacterium]
MRDHDIDTAVAAIPRDVPPARDLWPGVEARLRGTSRAWRPALAAAAAILVMTTAGLLLGRAELGTRPIVGAPDPRTPAAIVDASFSATRDALVRRLDAERRVMDPERSHAIARDLGTLSSAIDDVRAALASHPGNTRLVFELSRAHRAELRFLMLVTTPGPAD